MRTLTAIAAGLMTLAAVHAHAAATAYAEINWGGLIYEITSGQVSIDAEYNAFRLINLYSGLNVVGSNIVGTTINYSQDGQNAHVFNNEQRLRVDLASTHRAFDLIGESYGFWDVTLTGAGSATIRVPYEYHISLTDERLVRVSLSTSLSSELDSAPEYRFVYARRELGANEGLADGAGYLMFTVDTLGPAQRYRLGGTIDSIIVPGVPEPETYAMLGLGLGAVWMAQRRRKSAVVVAADNPR